jgi:hypothetical protein
VGREPSVAPVRCEGDEVPMSDATAAPLPVVQTAAAPLAFAAPALPRWRGVWSRFAVSGLTIAMAAVYGVQMMGRWSHEPFIWSFVVFLVGGAALLHVRHAGAQMVSRAALISSWTLGLLLCIEGGGRGRGVGFWLVLLGALALLLIRGVGITDTHLRRRRGLSAFFTAAAVMALADVMTLALCVGWQLDKHRVPSALLPMLIMVPGLVGLYRLRGWGLSATVLANVAVVGLLATGLVKLPEGELAALLVLTAALQVVSAGLLQIYRRLGPAWRRSSARVAIALSTAALCSISMLFAGGAALRSGTLLWGAIGL